MTILTGRIADVADEPIESIVIWVPWLRISADGSRVVTERRTAVYLDGGVLTTPDLDPGPARVSIGASVHHILIPDHPTPVDIGPLLDAGMPTPTEPGYGWVRTATGDIGRLHELTATEYAALTYLDPATTYLVFED